MKILERRGLLEEALVQPGLRSKRNGLSLWVLAIQIETLYLEPRTTRVVLYPVDFEGKCEERGSACGY